MLRGAVAAVCLLPPTFLMGASLPAIARWVETTPRGVSWLGLLYSANVAGAVTGCVLAGFYLLRVHDMAFATYIAAAINVAVALLALALASRDRALGRRGWRGTLIQATRAPGVAFVYAAIAFSGLTALGAEVVWTRLLSLLLGATVYTFSIILAVFLAGLWAGSGAGSFLARRVRDPRLALAGCQILLAAAIAWTAFTLAHVLPWWPVDPWLAINPWVNFDLDLTRMHPRHFPGHAAVGRELSVGAGRRGGEPGGSRTIDRRGLRGQYRRVHCGRAGFQSAADSGHRNAKLPTGVDLAGGGRRGGCRCAGGLRGRRLVSYIAGAAGRVGAVLLAWGLAATVGAVPWQAIAYGRRVAPILRGLNRAIDAETTSRVRGRGNQFVGGDHTSAAIRDFSMSAANRRPRRRCSTCACNA